MLGMSVAAKQIMLPTPHTMSFSCPSAILKARHPTSDAKATLIIVRKILNLIVLLFKE